MGRNYFKRRQSGTFGPLDPDILAPDTASGKVDRVIIGAFILFVILGGGATVAMRYTYVELPTFWGATVRFVIAACLFWLLVLMRRAPLPRGRALLGAVLFGLLSVGASFTLMYWGLVETPAGLAQIIIALVPLLTLFFAVAHGQERLHGRGLIGAVLAVAGIILALGGAIGTSASVPHLLAIFVAAACMAEASVVVKLFPQSDLISTNAVAMTVGAAILGLASIVSQEPRVLPSSTGVWLAFGSLVLGASLAWFLLYLFILKRWTASATSYGFVLMPIVTVILAASLTGETITWLFLIGSVFVCAGVWIGALQKS
jgi:drug/metabolite transporter (DMT)-like permease